MNQQQKHNQIRRWGKVLFWMILSVLFLYSFQAIMDFEGISNPVRLKGFMRVLTALSRPSFFEDDIVFQVWADILETIQMAFLATVMSSAIAIPLALFCTQASKVWSRGCNLLLQPILSAIRAVHPIIMILPAAVLAGIGPTAGVLSLTIFSTAVLLGSFIEFAHQHPSLSIGTLLTVHFPGLAFKHLPVNMVIASVLGFAGGGGIGLFLHQTINLLSYRDAGVAIIALIIVIGSTDLLARGVWNRILRG